MMATDYRPWDEEDRYWRENFASRPYSTGHNYEDFRLAYQYGYEAGVHHMGRTWNDVEPDLRTGWDKFEGKAPGGATWENIKDAVKEAWLRITGQRDLDADKMSEAEVDRLTRGGRPR
jgi:hypothetical protein